MDACRSERYWAHKLHFSRKPRKGKHAHQGGGPVRRLGGFFLFGLSETSGEAMRISRQVMREYLATVTRPQPWSPPVAMDAALGHLASLEARFEILEDGPGVAEMLSALCREVPVAGKQVHDANIVATMLAHGERRLLTFNEKDFRRYGERISLIDMERTP